MGQSTTLKQSPPIRTALRVSFEEARKQIQAQITEGEGFLNVNPASNDELDTLDERRRVWESYNKQLLINIFTSSEISEEYSTYLISSSYYLPVPLFDLIVQYKDRVKESLTRLKAIINRINLFPLSNTLSKQNTSMPNLGNDVFLVHGHNNEAKETVARFLEHLNLNVIILNEQDNIGQTIIEKLENHATLVGYAVVLLTGDDVGADRAMPNDLKPRARQNVVLELGYFYGSLGRKRVCALREENLESPSDTDGILYVLFDMAGAWKLRLAREIKAAGIKVDLDLVK